MRENIVHTVKQGDSLYKISKQYGVSTNEIISLNNLNNTILTIGQQLIIKQDQESPIEHIGIDICGPYQEEEKIQATKYNTYTVKKGDNLYNLAKKFDTTISDLVYINNLNNQTLSIGQVLKVPYTSQTTITYTVVPGDTLYKIASNYNTNVESLMKYNNLTSTTLIAGTTLEIPTSSNSSSNETVPVETIYTVKKGDTLYKIASNYNISVSNLISINNLPTTVLSIGQQLKISRASPTTTTYTVKKGDNLYSIASKYNVTVNELKQINNLTSNLLSINQVLTIPNY